MVQEATDKFGLTALLGELKAPRQSKINEAFISNGKIVNTKDVLVSQREKNEVKVRHDAKKLSVEVNLPANYLLKMDEFEALFNEKKKFVAVTNVNRVEKLKELERNAAEEMKKFKKEAVFVKKEVSEVEE